MAFFLALFGTANPDAFDGNIGKKLAALRELTPYSRRKFFVAIRAGEQSKEGLITDTP